MVTPDNSAYLAITATKECKTDENEELEHDDQGENDDSEDESGDDVFIADLSDYRWDMTRQIKMYFWKLHII